MRLFPALLLLLTATTSYAQWDLEDPPTTADLRGVYNVGAGIVWASGTHGTVVRSEDGGYLWQACAIPPRAENLDFRGIQAFDENTAIVMSSGKGDLSRLYKTTDGCHTWKLVFANPDKEGFWDGLQFSSYSEVRPNKTRFRLGALIGDSVNGKFPEFFTADEGEHWRRGDDQTSASSKDGESLFAASNSSLLYMGDGSKIFVTGGTSGSRSRILWENVKRDPHVSWKYVGGDIPFANGESAGAFSIATSFSPGAGKSWQAENASRVIYFPSIATCVVVGGDYKKPSQTSGTSAFSTDGGQHWKAAQTPPHGYRSAVAYDSDHKLWITVGPNGTDISTDDGKNWRALKPLKDQPADADQHWNALSLPFVVGPKGRIGKLNANALAPPKN